MKHRLFQYLESFQGGSCFLILAFLLLPYLIDVAYYGDLTPTDSAQEKLKECEDDRFKPHSSFLYPNDQEYSGEADVARQAEDYVAHSPAKAISRPQYLFIASRISRPPPAL
jgi:hypothetical protein